MPEEWGSAVIVPLYKGKGKRAEYRNYRGISLLKKVGTIFGGVLVDRICRARGYQIREGLKIKTSI